MTSRQFASGKVLLMLLALMLTAGACSSNPSSEAGEIAGQELVRDKLKLFVTEDGIYRVTADDMAANNLDTGEALSNDNISLSSGGDAVPFLLDEGDLIFYGQASDDRYFAERPYILQYGAQGLEMAHSEATENTGTALDYVKRTIRLEENHEYVSEARKEEESDVWFWVKLTQGETFSTDVSLPFVADGPSTLRVETWGSTYNPDIEGDHDFELFVNEASAGTVTYDGQNYFTAELSLPPGMLHDGKNRITLDNSAEGAAFLDIVQINWLELDYAAPPTAVNDRLDFTAPAGQITVTGLSGSPAVLDISDPSIPIQPGGWQYESGYVQGLVEDGMRVAIAGPRGYLSPRIEPVLESNWKEALNQADLIIVTTAELAPELSPLVAARKAEGLGVAVVPVNEIYDEFGYGAPSPETVRDFVTYAFENWAEPRPRYLLIVGDATSDYRGYLGEPPANIVPSLMVPVQFSGETVSDSRIVDIDGDARPDLAVGRWPMRTPQEVASLVERTLAYEQNPAGQRAIFATDASESTFSGIADDLIDASHMSRDQVDQVDGPTATEIADLWQNGAWLATYIGHGSIDRWGKEDMFNLDEIDKLDSESIPIVLQLTCLTGLYSLPEQVSLTEAMLLDPNGPVLAVGASSLTFSFHQEPFAEELLVKLQDSNIERVGDAFLAAKRSLEIEGADGLREISDTFALFGDPSAKIARP